MAYTAFSHSHTTESLGSIDSESHDVIPIDLRVNKLNYTITDKPGKWWEKVTNIQMPWEWLDKGSTKDILQDISFTAKSGQLMAIMGGSGSGKTSLLDVLACRASTGSITGDVYLNSVVRTKDILDSCAGYVRQDDRLISFLTVKETLTFVARLRLPKESSRKEIQKRVTRVTYELGLKHVADTKIGDESIRGLSGGERRRVSIGIQLLILPSLLFLDEPTSGLDSFTANNLVQTLSKLATKKRTVIMSIHQPRFDIFNMVDIMMILSKGKIVYSGPCADMVRYFTTLGFPCPEHINPCDFYIDLATVDYTGQKREQKSTQVVEELQAAYKVYADAIEIIPRGEHIISEQEFKRSVDSVRFHQSFAGRTDKERLRSMLDAFSRTRSGPGLLVQSWILLIRFLRITVDDYQMLLLHCVQALMMSVLLGLAFYELLLDQLSIRDWFGLMFMMSAMYPYMVILGIIGNCHEERRFLYFELQDKLYHPWAFYVAKILSEVPFHFFFVFLYCIPVYGMAGLKWEVYTFFIFYLFVSVSVFVSRCLAMMTAALLPTFQLSCVIAQTIFSIFLMSAGFFLNIDNMLPETKWMTDITYLRWGFNALCIIQVEDLTFPDCPQNASCVRTGAQAMEVYGLHSRGLWECAVGLSGTMAVFMVFLYLGIRYIPQKPHNE